MIESPAEPEVRALVALPDGSAWVRSGLVGAAGERDPAVGCDEHLLEGRLLRPEGVAQELRDSSARWVWWSAGSLSEAVHVGRCWDLAAVAGLRTGHVLSDPEDVYATALGRPPRHRAPEDQLPLSPAAAGDGGDQPLPPFAKDPNDARRLAAAALLTHRRQLAARQPGPGGTGAAALTDASESAAALLAVELEHRGLPLHVPTAHALLAEHLGPPPRSETEATEGRRRRDAVVLDLLPPRLAGPHDLRSPAAVRELLAGVGVVVPDTRSWRLEAYQHAHPFVAALLAWRKAERLETTYGYRWLEACVRDGRLRGRWGSFDGGAGRMTASSGLHNLPAELRPAVRAEPGHVLVRADLGQVEPRVLAVVSRDPALRAACADQDLYAPVAARLGCDRPRAKVAVLAAMYGQRSGTAGEALAQMELAYPLALQTLQQAEDVGRSGGSLRTYGGRLVGGGAGAGTVEESSGRGRWLRNALIQGSAAELFKMWAVTVRAALAHDAPGAEIVLCLHDELLVHVPEPEAAAAVRALHGCLADVARWWTPDFPVRFVAEVSTDDHWSKG